jgi:hypothetical protein
LVITYDNYNFILNNEENPKKTKFSYQIFINLKQNQMTKRFILLGVIMISILSCSKDNDSSCNDIVCGGISGSGSYIIYRGTLNPDTCGETELEVNEATFLFYQAKWQANPEGYTCWEGLK